MANGIMDRRINDFSGVQHPGSGILQQRTVHFDPAAGKAFQPRTTGEDCRLAPAGDQNLWGEDQDLFDAELGPTPELLRRRIDAAR